MYLNSRNKILKKENYQNKMDKILDQSVLISNFMKSLVNYQFLLHRSVIIDVKKRLIF